MKLYFNKLDKIIPKETDKLRDSHWLIFFGIVIFLKLCFFIFSEIPFASLPKNKTPEEILLIEKTFSPSKSATNLITFFLLINDKNKSVLDYTTFTLDREPIDDWITLGL